MDYSEAMNIKFTDLFNKESREKFHIAESNVREAITNPTDSQEITYKGLSLLFTTKQLDQYTLLIFGRKDADEISVDLAFKIKPDLVKGAAIRKPMDLLQKLIERFGLVTSIGDLSQKLFIEQTIEIKQNAYTDIVKIANPDNHNFAQSMFIRINNSKQVECAMAFAIDTTKYIEWINAS